MANAEFDGPRLITDELDQLQVCRELFDAIELCNHVKEHKALGIHVLAEIKVLAQILYGEVILPIQC
jgi:hypothetical protein